MSEPLVAALERLRPVLQRLVIRQWIKDNAVPDIWPSDNIPRGTAYEMDRALLTFDGRTEGRVLLVNREDYEAALRPAGREDHGDA